MAHTYSDYGVIFAQGYMQYLRSGNFNNFAKSAHSVLKGNSPIKFAVLSTVEEDSQLCLLSLAAMLGKLGLLPKGAFVPEAIDKRDVSGRTVFHYAAMNNGLKVLEPYFTAARLLARDNAQSTPIHYLCVDDPSKLDELGISVELFTKSSEDNAYALASSAKHGKIHLYNKKYLTRETLIERVFAGKRAVHVIAEGGEYNQIPLALANELLAVQDGGGNTPLHYIFKKLSSSQNNFPDWLDDDAICRAMRCINTSGETPLAVAGAAFDIIPVKFLTAKSMGPTHEDSDADAILNIGKNPFGLGVSSMARLASSVRKISIEQIAGGVLSVQDHRGYSFMHHLAAKGHIDRAFSALEVSDRATFEEDTYKRASSQLASALKLVSPCGRMPLHVQADEGLIHLAPKKALTHEFMCMRDAAGRTVLHTAALLRQLHNLPSSVLIPEWMQLQDDCGVTPLLNAASHKFDAVPLKCMTAETLTVADNSGRTPLQVGLQAIMNGIISNGVPSLAPICVSNPDVSLTPEGVFRYIVHLPLSPEAEALLPDFVMGIRSELKKEATNVDQVQLITDDAIDLDF